MKKYDHIVVGSGISGLTMSLLLSMGGNSVLLIEKSPTIGGSLSRFSRGGVSFDTGFHFTGGFHQGGILSDILTLLGMHGAIQPIFLPGSAQNQFVFESHAQRFDHPSGIENITKAFKGYFPAEAGAIDRYFHLVQSVCLRTPSLNLRENVIAPPNLEEDFVSLDSVLKDLTSNVLLRGLLSGYAMCYGVRPAEISFANHCRMVLSFYESIAFVQDGGDGFINAFREQFKQLNVDVRCNTYITELADVRDSKVGRFVLNSGEEIQADNCVLTIHPQEILKLLPEKQYSKAFASRVQAFEPSLGLFSLFAVLKPGVSDPHPDASIVSLFPDPDMNNLLDPAYRGQPALVVVKPPDHAAGAAGKGISIVEPSFAGDISRWYGTRRGQRPEGYLAYKQGRVEAIKEHLFGCFPAYRDTLDFVDAGSMLTYKDYLCSPDGSAYGIKQKMGQFNLVGKLPLHNLFAAGQSALLPGVIGAMMSSLIVGRAILGKEHFGKILDKNLCH
ncbi:MAG: NAD(P)/FAD-dependent oxidoreductase [Desulfuromonadales bacterium]|nr:NAD(P)/FAD-dependent oxidoreductase [Desulfuromonadales bacterium]